jgi:hypothetical protein
MNGLNVKGGIEYAVRKGAGNFIVRGKGGEPTNERENSWKKVSFLFSVKNKINTFQVE